MYTKSVQTEKFYDNHVKYEIYIKFASPLPACEVNNNSHNLKKKIKIIINGLSIAKKEKGLCEEYLSLQDILGAPGLQ